MNATRFGTSAAVAAAAGQLRIAHAAPGEPLQAGAVLAASGQPHRHLNWCRWGADARRSEAVERWRSAFHTFTLEWQPENITVAVDDEVFCTLRSAFAEQRVNGRLAPAAAAWTKAQHGGAVVPMTPFDQEFYVTLGVAVGGVGGDFPDDPRRPYPAGVKPWRNDDASGAERQFWRAVGPQAQWPGGEEEAKMLVDYVRVYAL